ncbi:serine hydrolase domain-containing protein [Polyangium sp. y55x31]|uniref:serine hydrolase domain-containing protein n=1 Tax=Polyangium sp. y55x31 TaxID=3042688 RepID=UPI002482F3F0|nr:serine hydrolase domain-containing protein [Polyangium sp. y55x31]MDI1482476.1 serine hydrolase domain-containing protein [Polyangium sp. y55x31]
MRSLLPAIALVTLAACSSSPEPTAPTPPVEPARSSTPAASATPTAAPEAPAPPAVAGERLAADTPKTTVSGNTFIAPNGWTISVKGQATILEAPEAGSRIALVDVQAKDADAAVALAWAAYGADKKWPLKSTVDAPDKDGWSRIKIYDYQTSPNEKRDVGVMARFANDTWTVVIYDMAQAVGEKRGAQVGQIYGRLLPKGRARESFAGKKANTLDQARIAALGKFVETAQQKLGVPGVSIGLIQGGKVVFAGGFGARELGKKPTVDADTKYIIASNTKALTTLMLAKLVEEKKLTWETPATALLPSFKLGDQDTTSRVLVKHLICACTGMPRQDLEWIFQFQGVTPEGALGTLATMQPTSKFGELFQYSNPLAAAAGFLGGHVAFPKLELGKAYDEAMRTRVFEPLGMKGATFDFKRAQTGNYAAPHAQDVDGKPARATAAVNDAVIPVRPAGGAWATVNDVLKYVQMELAEGKLPDGKQYIEKDILLARRAPQVSISPDATYGMGLMVDKKWGVTVVHHGGDLIGFHSDMMWLPEHGVGAVVLTNGDPGWLIRSVFQRKLLEVLFDGNAEADTEIATMGKMYFDQMAAERKLLTIPADAAESAKLAAHYTSAALGDVKVSRAGAATIFDFGEWKSEVASKKNPDGTISFVTTAPGILGVEFVVGGGAKRTLTIRDAQHEYVFNEK